MGPETVPGKYRHRKFVLHNPQASSLGLNAKEMRMVAKAIARKLNLAKGPTAVLIPVEGFSSVNKQGHPLYNPKLNRIFIDTLRQHLQPQVAFKERQAHMNDRQFAEFIGQIFEELVPPSA